MTRLVIDPAPSERGAATTARGLAAELAPLAARLEARAPGRLSLAVRLWDGSELGRPGGHPAVATLVVRSPQALARAVRAPGELGFARAWVTGELDVDGDLEATLRAVEGLRGIRLSPGDRLAALRAVRRLGALRRRAPAPPAAEARLSGRLHSLRRDREAVRHHYDVPSEFYRIVLGPSMIYSCAYFASRDDSLEEAQERKLDVVCRKLRLAEGERLLDVGCGWGALIVHAAANYGVRAVGVTLSEPQAAIARERVRAAGLQDRCEVRVADYREVSDGPFDKVASVGMYEHVGAGELDRYFDRIRALTRPGGLVLNHGIVRATPGRPSRDTFIARYVFPDYALHTAGEVVGGLERAGLELRDAESLREHYPLTLRRWTANLGARTEEAVAIAGPERERVWRLYMHASALAFERGEISVQQVLGAAPGAPHGLPLARPAMGRSHDVAEAR